MPDSEIYEIKKQNKFLLKTIDELRSAVVGSLKLPRKDKTIDLSGTWINETFDGSDMFCVHFCDYIVFYYGDPRPGIFFGVIRDEIYRFSWTRFDESLLGKGFLRINEAQNHLKGGIWFDSGERELDSMEKYIGALERHLLKKKSIKITKTGKKFIEKALSFLQDKKLIEMPNKQ